MFPHEARKRFNRDMTPYMIQRVKLKTKPFDKLGGVDDNFKYDYMGSAEFEFGALSKSLSRINNFDLTVSVIDEIKDYTGKPLRIIHPDVFDIKDEYIQCLIELRKNENAIKTKEYVNLKDNADLELSINSWNKVDIWWDIRNDLFFTFGKVNAKKVITSVGNTND